uniref:Uncharacterized protein n=1 Tax=Setaria italica TaxID=4555 RepID=K3YZU3_SETIT
YCHADAAYLCASCDTQVHSVNHVASSHERVHLCEVCMTAPAVSACCADAAELCTTCDAKVHSANSLSQRHQRVPVLPLPATSIPAVSGFAEAGAAVTTHGSKEKEEVDSWLLFTRDSGYNYGTTTTTNNNSSKMYFGKVDQYFDVTGYNSYYGSNIIRNTEEQYRMQEHQQIQRRYGATEWSECVVPSQLSVVNEHAASITNSHHSASGYNPLTNRPPLNYRVVIYLFYEYASKLIESMSCKISVWVQKDATPDISNLTILTTGGVDLLSYYSFQMPVHLSPMDRAARVLRYKEKRQARKFEKTIRYATRKAYAEARPRIKGRFAKRSDVELQVDHMSSSPPDLPNSSYGTVPWF